MIWGKYIWGASIWKEIADSRMSVMITHVTTHTYVQQQTPEAYSNMTGSSKLHPWTQSIKNNPGYNCSSVPYPLTEWTHLFKATGE